MSANQPETEQWLSLSQAAKRLGIHPTTLRRWVDQGSFPAYRTPGGHRRFAAADIDRAARTYHHPDSTDALGQLWAERAMIQTRQEIMAREDKPWLATQDDQVREQHRIMGRRLMGLTLQYISDIDGNGALLEEARGLGAEYGRLAQASGLPLTEALQATLFFRDTLVEAALQLPESADVRPEANLRLTRRLNALLNAVHLAIAASYEES